MRERHRKIIYLGTIIVSLTVLAAPALGDDWYSVNLGTNGFGLAFGSSNWSVYGSSWHDPYWSVSYDAALAGYGEWVWVSGLGRCWRPYVEVNWRPFTHGRWVWTSYGWTWVAYEPWGYFPHHYGQWAHSHHGWVWTPGYSYRAANVVWVRTGNWLGWYACAPRGWSHAHRGYHRGYRNGYGDGYWDGWNDARYATYTEWRHLGSDNISRHAVPYSSVRRSAPSTPLRGTAAPPSRAETRRRGGLDLPEARLDQRKIRAGDRTITVARPRGMNRSIEQNARSTANIALSPNARRRVFDTDGSRIGESSSRGRGGSSDQRSLQSTAPQSSRQRQEGVAVRESSSRERAGRSDNRSVESRAARSSRSSRTDVESSRPLRDATTVNRTRSNAGNARSARPIQKSESPKQRARTVTTKRESRRVESTRGKISRSQAKQHSADDSSKRAAAREKKAEPRSKGASTRRKTSPTTRRR